MNREAEILFDALVELSPAEREAYFQQHSIPPQIRTEVEQLLLFDERSDHALTASVAQVAGEWVAGGERCGAYRLIRVLGQGGMGSVHLAERADGEVQQLAAIKFLHPGANSAAFGDRFLQERRILARLNHHGIARMLDAGHTTDGRPYLVMEYIDGVPIDQFAEGLDTAAKLESFLRVCDAVSYAHRNLVIHRDLKPSNILVDASGEPKLLDFGIAKILDASLDQTQTREQLLTPEYASPEQVRGSAQTTATDIYSLGAVLYKLLTGRAPFAGREYREELLSAICSVQPARPSSLADVPHDLDFIAGKALRKEPEERYRTVEALADDIRAFLEFRPVHARSGNAWYRARKFARRCWIPVTAGTLVIASLATGLYMADRERAIAERRFRQVRQLATKVIGFDLDLRDLAGATKARNRVVATSLEYLAALAPEARKDNDLALEIADAYAQLGRIQGFPGHSSLGRYEDAKTTLDKAEVLAESVLSREKDNKRALLGSAWIAHDRMAIAATERNPAVAFEEARVLEQRLDRLSRLGKLTSEQIGPMTYLYGNAAIAYNNGNRFEDGIRAARRGIEISQGVDAALYYHNMAVGALSSGLRWTGDLEGALAAAREYRTAMEKESGNRIHDRLNLAEALLREGRILGDADEVSLGRPEEAIGLLTRSLRLVDEIAAKDRLDSSSRHRIADAAFVLGGILRSSDPAKALAIYDSGLARAREVENNLELRRDEAMLLADSAYPLRRLHRDSEAQRRIDAAFQILREIKDYPADVVAPIDPPHVVLRALADHYGETGRVEKAAETYRELLKRVMASRPEPENNLRNATLISNDRIDFAVVLKRLGRVNEASQVEAERREMWRDWKQRLPNNGFVARQMAAGR